MPFSFAFPPQPSNNVPHVMNPSTLGLNFKQHLEVFGSLHSVYNDHEQDSDSEPDLNYNPDLDQWRTIDVTTAVTTVMLRKDIT